MAEENRRFEWEKPDRGFSFISDAATALGMTFDDGIWGTSPSSTFKINNMNKKTSNTLKTIHFLKNPISQALGNIST